MGRKESNQTNKQNYWLHSSLLIFSYAINTKISWTGSYKGYGYLLHYGLHSSLLIFSYAINTKISWTGSYKGYGYLLHYGLHSSYPDIYNVYVNTT